MIDGTGRTAAADGSRTDTEWTSDSDVDPASESNVGAGEHGTGHVSLDFHSSVEPDVQGTATTLLFAEETFDVVEMAQVLEHVPPSELGDVFEDVHRVLQWGGPLAAWVSHAASRLNDQDPTHRSSWTYGTPEYFADGTFSWYDDCAIDLVDREVTVWMLEDTPLSGPRSVLLRTIHRLLEWTDGVIYRPSVSGSILFTLRKV
ncbi:methyltransferase domain-containing protein [Natrinema gelatinilyticum]|uniref:methyltransferase domain-containing protein n=1 Tax=Natrinema gelatinilyticum TaxID=2961571 RepID=UPI0020C3FB04|nr:methyltransferase domain-containing protein [Natrinema gelatinilyticum]